MKKLNQMMLLLMFTLAIVGCEKDDKKDHPKENYPVYEMPRGSYSVTLDGASLMEKQDGYAHISETVNGVNSAISIYSSNLTNGQIPEQSITIANIHNLKVGETVDANQILEGTSSKIELIITTSTSNQEAYTITQGTLTRTSESKISFQATKVTFYKTGNDAPTVLDKNLTGYISSDLIKKIGTAEEE